MRITQHGILFVFFLLLLSGCSANTYIQKVSPVKDGIAAYNKITVSVKSENSAIEKHDGFDISKSELERQFVTHLAETNKFKLVTSSDDSVKEPGLMQITLVIEDFNYVSGAASVMGGVLSGNARLKVLAQLTDSETGTPLGELRAGAQTRSSGGIFRGSTGTLITDISRKLADEIAGYKKP